MGKETEVRAKLRVDDSAAKPGIDRTKKGFQDVGHAAKDAQSDAMSFIRQTASQYLAFNAGNMIGQIKSTAMSFVDAAAGAQEARRSMAATSVVLEGTPWGMAADHARESQKALTEMGESAGFTGTEVRTAFTAMLESTDASAAAVANTKVELEQATKIADAFSMNLEAAGREIGFMHEGTLRTRGQMFQLLKSTGIFGNDVHKAAEGWAKLTDAQRTTLLDRGLSQVGAKLEGLPTSYRRITGQIGAVFEGIKKDIGEPLVDALGPVMQEVLVRLRGARGEIREIVKTLGPQVAAWVRQAADAIGKGLGYLSDHGADIKDAIVEGFTFAKETVEFILRHKEELALAFGGAKAFQLGGAIAGANVGGKIASVGSEVGGAMGLTGAAATAAGLAAVAAAAVAAAGALYLIDKYSQGREQMKDTQGGNKANLELLAKGGHVKEVQALLDSMNATDEYAKHTRGTIGDIVAFFDQSTDNALGMTEDSFRQWQSDLIGIASQASAQTKQLEEQAQLGATGGQFEDVVAAYNSARELQNFEAQKFAAAMLVQSGFTAEAIRVSGLEIAGGMDEFTNLFTGSADFLKAALATFKGGAGGATAKPPQISMSGGQSFHINQDFRGEDPDNIAIVFERDIGRLVQRRIGASTGGAFGT